MSYSNLLELVESHLQVREYPQLQPAPKPTFIPDLNSYDIIAIALCGKDSLACLLHLLDLGVPPSKIECHHHLVDGKEGSDLFDWACVEDYLRKLCAALGIPLYFSWRVNGIEGELFKENARSAAARFEAEPGGQIIQVGGTRGRIDTRRMFPAPTADLRARWCSPKVKIDVMDVVLCNSPRFKGSRTLFISGERRQESANRAKYNEFEAHRADCRDGRPRRHIDHWRPCIDWKVEHIWHIIWRQQINPCPPYRLGFSRLSCMMCIFADPDQIASVYAIAPEKVLRHFQIEQEFGHTIHHKRKGQEIIKVSIMDRVQQGTPYPMRERDIRAALSREFNEPIILAPHEWELPLGAFGTSAGPS